MLVLTPDGMAVKVERRWMPWRLRKRDWGNPFGNPFGLIEAADDLAGSALGLVLGIVLFVFGGVILSVTLLAGEGLLLLLLLVPLFLAARMFWVLPWIIEASNGITVLGQIKVRGWRDSEERLREIATTYEQGSDPFASEKTTG